MMGPAHVRLLQSPDQAELGAGAHAASSAASPACATLGETVVMGLVHMHLLHDLQELADELLHSEHTCIHYEHTWDASFMKCNTAVTRLTTVLTCLITRNSRCVKKQLISQKLHSGCIKGCNSSNDNT